MPTTPATITHRDAQTRLVAILRKNRAAVLAMPPLLASDAKRNQDAAAVLDGHIKRIAADLAKG